MLIKTRGIVFRQMAYKDTSVITDIYTDALGLQSYLINGVRKPKATIQMSTLQPMTIVDVVAYHRPNRDLNRIKEIRPHLVYRAIPFDLRRGAVGLFMLEVMRKCLREPEENPLLFEYLYQLFAFLDQTEAGFVNLHLHFLCRLSRYLGFLPMGEASEETPYFDMQEGCFVSIHRGHVHTLETELSLVISQILQARQEELGQIRMSRRTRKEVLLRLLDFYRLHVENFPEIHSHHILEEVLGA